ncbi:MAG: type VI secretion system-associated FHA domain protein TagH [Pseudomonadota bacterium]
MSAATMELLVLAYDGAQLNTATSRGFDKVELTIGRSPTNDLVLDDPDRLISRFQAKVSLLDPQSAVIVNVSSSSTILINDTELPPGASSVVRTLDRLLVGRYLLALNPCEARQPEPLLDLEPIARAPAPFPAAHNMIPADFDVFARPAVSEPEPAADEISLEDFSDASNSLKAVFEGMPSLEREPLPESLGEARSRAKALDVSAVGQLDPLSMFGGGLGDLDPLLAPPSQELDHGLEVDALFHTPALAGAFSIGLPPEPAPIELIPADPLPVERPIVERLPPAGRHMPSEPAAPPSRAPEIVSPTAPSPVEVLAVAPSPAVPVPAKAPVAPGLQSGAGLTEAALLKTAFARGSGLPEATAPAITPAFMESLGRIFAGMTAGTIRLMHARSAMKHEIRANVTIIASAGNNPLKFAPDGQSAVTQLLGQRFPGFMEPQRAIEDAFDDLSAHQVGLLAGARSAMYELIGRFSPERLKQRLGDETLLDSLLPSMRKAKLWELYEGGFLDIAGEAREEFEMLFQSAFARAYEQEIERIVEGREA